MRPSPTNHPAVELEDVRANDRPCEVGENVMPSGLPELITLCSGFLGNTHRVEQSIAKVTRTDDEAAPSQNGGNFPDIRADTQRCASSRGQRLALCVASGNGSTTCVAALTPRSSTS